MPRSSASSPACSGETGRRHRPAETARARSVVPAPEHSAGVLNRTPGDAPDTTLLMVGEDRPSICRPALIVEPLREAPALTRLSLMGKNRPAHGGPAWNDFGRQ